jgi:predicted MPP superfamily phosphohydrolase
VIKGKTAPALSGRTVLGIGAALGAAGLAYARFEAGWHALRRVSVPVLAPGTAPLRVLHLTDLHLTGSDQRRANWVRRLASETVDLVIVTGDNLARPEGLTTLLGALEPFFGTPGAFVFGSNDYFSAQLKNPARYLLRGRGRSERQRVLKRKADLPFRELRAVLTRAGWADLNNSRALLRAGPAGTPVRLTGLDDPHIGRDELPSRLWMPGGGGAEGSTDGGGGADAGEGVAIGVVHSPYARALRALADDGARLILAGHTHGGQLAAPGWGALISNCDLDPRKARGLSGWPGARPDAPGGEESVWLHVSAGLGTSPFTPFRFACRPEATILELRPRAGFHAEAPSQVS